MNKNELAVTLAALTVDQTVGIKFTREHDSLSGEYRVVGTTRGRGRGGPVLTMLVNDDRTLNLGSSSFNKIEALTVGAETHVMNNIAVAQDFDMATRLKQAFNDLAVGNEVEISSDSTVFNGRFKVVGKRVKRGRFGQVVLMLEDCSGMPVEIWSYRHSGVIRDLFLVVNDGIAGVSRPFLFL